MPPKKNDDWIAAAFDGRLFGKKESTEYKSSDIMRCYVEGKRQASWEIDPKDFSGVVQKENPYRQQAGVFEQAWDLGYKHIMELYELGGNVI